MIPWISGELPYFHSGKIRCNIARKKTIKISQLEFKFINGRIETILFLSSISRGEGPGLSQDSRRLLIRLWTLASLRFTSGQSVHRRKWPGYNSYVDIHLQFTGGKQLSLFPPSKMATTPLRTMELF
ncbi:hypothetical protein AVEN_264999-1, partial [Araneus ventricosus]